MENIIKYTFMNKNVELFDVEMNHGSAIRIENIRENNKHLLPVFLLRKYDSGLSPTAFNSWWSGRRIPASREGVKALLWSLKDDVMNEPQINNLDHLAEKAMGLSLSDQYWIRPNEGVKWDDVNFFTNPFSDDIGRLLTTGDWNAGDLLSPDNTSDGVVKKRWKIINNMRCLIKGGYSAVGYIGAQPRREVFASKLAKVLMLPHSKKYVVPYHIATYDDEQFSVCPNFVTPRTEYVQFNQLVSGQKFKSYDEGFNYCRAYYGENAYVMDVMFILDYLVLNEDRHTGNFGMIRDVSTGDFVEPAPIFDTGSSLFHNSMATNESIVLAKPFDKSHEKQISLINLGLYRESLENAQSDLFNIFYDSFDGSNEGEERLNGIFGIVNRRITDLLSR
jgi:hypothetical protein